MPITTGIAAAAPIIGGAIGRGVAGGYEEQADEARRRALEEISGIRIPTVEEQRLALEAPELVGTYTPEQELAEQLAASRMEEISVDPRLKAAQMQALETMQRMGVEGLSPVEKAALNEARRETERAARGREEAILQNLAQRGVAGSGLELAARQQASQQAAQRAAEESDRIMAMAQQRALASIAQSGQLGGQMRQQEFGEQSKVASAADEIARFNALQRAAVQQRNIGATNIAAQRNLAERQRIAEAAARTRNLQEQYNKALIAQRYGQEMEKGKAMAGAYGGQAQTYGQQAGEAARYGAGMGEAAGGLISAVGDIGREQDWWGKKKEEEKEPIKPEGSW
jgi:hypothetical protein